MTAYAMKEDLYKCMQAGMTTIYLNQLIRGNCIMPIGKVMEGRVCELEQHALTLEEVHEMLMRVDGNRELLQELVEMFFQDYYEDMTKLKESMDKKDTPALAVVVHGLKGVLGNLGFKNAYKLACELEKMIRANILEAPAMVRQLETEIKGLERFFSHPQWQEQI